MSAQTAWPERLTFRKSAKALHVRFDDGFEADIPFELLRVESPSAEVKGHGGAEKTIVPGKLGVGVTRAEPVGRYAVRIVFDDGHDSGLFTWAYLRELAETQDEVMATYIAALKARGLSRT